MLYQFLVRHEQEAEAATILNRALEASPESVFLRLFKAARLEQAQDWDGAIAIYEALYETESFDPVIANNLASLITTYRSDQANLDRAYLIARRLRGTDIPAFQDTYGWIVFRRGDPAAALPHLKSAAQGLPKDPMVQYHLGAAHFALGNRDAAREILSRALDLAAGSPLPQYEEAREYLADLGAE
jgi:Flp pilus assembly protein TadD